MTKRGSWTTRIGRLFRFLLPTAGEGSRVQESVSIEATPKWRGDNLFLRDVSDQGYAIERHIKVPSSPASILDGIERYFNTRGQILQLIVPLSEVGMPGTLALERRVTVELKRYPRSAAEEDRLGFRGRDGAECLTAEFGAVFDHETAQDTGRLLLEELKAVLETEAETVNEFNREELERGGLVPQFGWRATRGRFW